VTKTELEERYQMVQDVGEVWRRATEAERCELAPMLFAQIYLENGLVKQIMPTAPLSALIFGVLDTQTERTGFEPARA
jgi:hypothetical protein